MFKPKLRQLPYKSRIVVAYPGMGLNNGAPVLDLKDGELTEVQNGYSGAYPSFEVRPSRSNYGTALTTPKGIGKRQDDYLVAQDGTTWKKWNTSTSVWDNLATGLTSADCDIIDFMDKTILVNGTDKKYWDGSASGDISDMPASHFLAVHRNRLYTANTGNQNLNISALRKYDDFSTAGDAATIVVETRDGGGCTGLVQYRDHIIFFKATAMLELFGTNPNNWQMQVASEQIGCISHRSIVEVDGILYFLSNEGVRAYGGGSDPELISYNVQDYIDDMDRTRRAAAGTDGRRYYISLPVSNDGNVLLVYDTLTKTWMAEDDTAIIAFTNLNNILYGLDSEGQIHKMVDTDGEEEISWYAVLKPFSFDRVSGKKTFKNVYVTFSMPTGSSMKLYGTESAEGGTYTELYTYTAGTNIQNVKTMVPLTTGFNCDWMKLKLTGTGACTIHKMEIQARVRPNGW